MLKLCKLCGAVTNQFYCSYCSQRIPKPRSLLLHKEYDFKTWSLYQWDETNHKIAKRSIYALKSSKYREWYDFAFHFSALWEGPRKNSILIPAPSKGERDHAFYFAQALSDLWQIPLWTHLFSRQNFDSQKSKNRSERKALGYDQLHPIPGYIKNVYFVDDLIATGSTARAAYVFMPPELEFECLCLFQRKRNL